MEPKSGLNSGGKSGHPPDFPPDFRPDFATKRPFENTYSAVSSAVTSTISARSGVSLYAVVMVINLNRDFGFNHTVSGVDLWSRCDSRVWV